ncbi:MAG TPA: thiamine pyrophosphate-binding protein [Anaerolineae bacterium]|nr:thiamine pyrophosphate-binding protein [Anaerolineae bacterium]
MTQKTGRFAILEQFLADGMTHMFGNPGTVEQGFLDALADYPQMRYVLTLQESVAVLAADGYARATQRPTLVQLHSSPGIGNAIGAVYQAKRGHSPLVIIGGDAGLRYMNTESQMYGDLVAFMEPVTKWSTMVLEPANLLRVLRRAVKVAGTPPMGPVYVCLPADVLDALSTETVYPALIPSTRVQPETSFVHEAAALLAAGAKPMIFVGDGVAYSGAQAELEKVAELLGAEVWEADSGEVNMAYDHPLYQGMTGHMFGSASLPLMQRGDANLIVGTYVLPEVFPHLGDIWASGAKVVHIDLNAYEIGKNHRVDLAVVADPKLSLALLAGALEAGMTADQRAAADARTAEIGAAKAAKRAAQIEADQAAAGKTPLSMAPFMAELAKQLPSDNVVIFDEALTSSPAVVRYFPPQRTGEYFLTRGGSLGIGFPGAIGAKLANPGKTVIGFSGDGGSMYTIQALWTAARHNIDVKFVVCNNGSYRLLQLNIDQYWKDQGVPKHDFPLSFDLSSPPLHFVDLAKGMSVPGLRVETPEQIAPAIQQMLATPGPFLIDLVLEGDTHPERIGNTCGQ